MSTEANKGLVRRWFESGMNSGSAAEARLISAEVFAEDFVDHDGVDGGTQSRPAWQAAVVDVIFGAFADIEVTIDRLFAEDKFVAVRYVFTGTHVGEFFGVPATGRRIRHTENEIYRVRDGQIAESWGEGDWLGTLRHPGLAPCGQSATAVEPPSTPCWTGGHVNVAALDEELAAAVRKHHEASDAILHGDATLLKRLYCHSEDVTLAGHGGG